MPEIWYAILCGDNLAKSRLCRTTQPPFTLHAPWTCSTSPLSYCITALIRMPWTMCSLFHLDFPSGLILNPQHRAGLSGYEARKYDKASPLFAAVKNSNIRMAKMLLEEFGADPNIRDRVRVTISEKNSPFSNIGGSCCLNDELRVFCVPLPDSSKAASSTQLLFCQSRFLGENSHHGLGFLGKKVLQKSYFAF